RPDHDEPYRFVNNLAPQPAPAWLAALAADPSQDDPEQAATTLLAMGWPQAGAGRHQAAVVLGGFLARAGRTPEQVAGVVGGVLDDDDRAKALIRTASDAAKTRERGRNAYGFPALAKTFSLPVAERVAGWLGYPLQNDGGEQFKLTVIKGNDVTPKHQRWLWY